MDKIIALEMKWHGKKCKVLVRPIYRKGVKRNALIEVDGVTIVVPIRALRRNDGQDNCTS